MARSFSQEKNDAKEESLPGLKNLLEEAGFASRLDSAFLAAEVASFEVSSKRVFLKYSYVRNRSSAREMAGELSLAN